MINNWKIFRGKKITINNISNQEEKNRKLEEVDSEMINVLKNIQRDNFEREIKDLKETKATKGRSASVFKLRDKILGSKKAAQEQVIIKDPITGTDIHTPEGIKEASLNYCIKLLTKREPKPAYKDVVEAKKVVHFERMKEVIPNNVEELPEDLFFKVLDSLSKEPGDEHQFIVKSGYGPFKSV